MIKAHDNHVAAYNFRQAMLASLAKSQSRDDALVRRYEAGLWLSKVDTKEARRIIRQRKHR